MCELLGRLVWIHPFEEVRFSGVLGETVGLNLSTQNCYCIDDKNPCTVERTSFCYDRVVCMDGNYEYPGFSFRCNEATVWSQWENSDEKEGVNDCHRDEYQGSVVGMGRECLLCRECFVEMDRFASIIPSN